MLPLLLDTSLDGKSHTSPAFSLCYLILYIHCFNATFIPISSYFIKAWGLPGGVGPRAHPCSWWNGQC